MALRKIVMDGDPILKKRTREVTAFDSRLHSLIDDMRETLAEAAGLGLAAPQVGVMRRVAIVVDDEENMIEIINPEIISAEDETDGAEGCLSFPDIWGVVQRPYKVTVRAQDRFGKFFEVSGEAITARAFCHEIDHLNGVVFTELVLRYITAEEVAEMRSDDE